MTEIYGRDETKNINLGEGDETKILDLSGRKFKYGQAYTKSLKYRHLIAKFKNTNDFSSDF